ncbi:MAG: T9SS type A sorting domain-containing protein [Bacteroidia bacterium]
MSVSLGPTPLLKPVRSERKDFSDDYLQLDWFEFDWDEFQRPGSEHFLYFAIIEIKEKGCNESMTIVKQICLSSLTEIHWDGYCEKSTDITYAFGLDPQGGGQPVTRLQDTLNVTSYMLNQYAKSSVQQVMGKHLHTKGSILLDSTAFHFKAEDEILVYDEFESVPGNLFTAYIEDAGPVFWGCSNYTGYTRTAGETPFGSGSKHFFSLGPNPIRQGQALRLKLFCSSARQTELSLFSLGGQKLWQQSIEVHEGENSFATPLPNLSAGMYVVKIRLGDEVISQKLLVLN